MGFSLKWLCYLHAAVSKKSTLAEAGNSVLTSRVFHKLWGDFGLCASACSTSALAAHNFNCFTARVEIDAWKQGILCFFPAFYGLARDFVLNFSILRLHS